MKYFGKPYLTLFLLSTLYQLFYIGLYSIYQYYYLPGLNEVQQEQYVFSNKGLPSKMDFLFSGFQSDYSIIYALTVGVIVTIVAKKLKTFNYLEKAARQIGWTVFSWTTLFTAVYVISDFAWYTWVSRSDLAFSFNIIRAQLPLLIIGYVILIIPTVLILYRKS